MVGPESPSSYEVSCDQSVKNDPQGTISMLMQSVTISKDSFAHRIEADRLYDNVAGTVCMSCRIRRWT
jgi:hypothetical protein